jgi:hypothetical protein
MSMGRSPEAFIVPPSRQTRYGQMTRASDRIERTPEIKVGHQKSGSRKDGAEKGGPRNKGCRDWFRRISAALGIVGHSSNF